MPSLKLGSVIKIEGHGYQALISPSAGARILKMTYSNSKRTINCLVPLGQLDSFEMHEWPKAGAFVMLPFTNRLDPPIFEWDGNFVALQNGSSSGQGLHGFGHRSQWEISNITNSSLSLEFEYSKKNHEWPWTFLAKLTYSLDEEGLTVLLSIHNTDNSSMPVCLGWHPFIPFAKSHINNKFSLNFSALHSHEIGLDGLGIALPSEKKNCRLPFHIFVKDGTTTAYENLSTPVEINLGKNIRMKLNNQHAPHLLVHSPIQGDYICVEPISALPGALKNYKKEQSKNELCLLSGDTRNFKCNLQAILVN
jgi:aldose 1-epimerase